MSVDTIGESVLGGLVDGKLEGLEHVVLEILGVFDTAAQSDKVVKDADGLSLVTGNTGVCHAAGQLDEGLDSAQGLGQGEDLGDLAEALGGRVAAADAERQHAAAHAVAVLADRNGSVGVGVQAGVVDGDDVGRGLEGVADGGSVAGGLASAEVEGLEAAVGEPRVECRGDGADGVLEEGKTRLELVAVEGGYAHDDVAVAIDVLGDAVDDDVGPEVERVLDVGRQEGVVDDDEDAMLVGLGDNGADIDEAESRVGRALDPDEAGLVVDVLADVDLNLGGEGDLDAVGLGDLGEVAMGAAIDVGDGDDVAASSQALQDGGRGCAARGEGQGVAGMLEGSDSRLEVGAVGVGGARILVLADRLADGRLGEGRGEGDGLDDGAGVRVVGRAGMDGERAEGVHGCRGTRGRRDGVRGDGRRHFDCVTVICVRLPRLGSGDGKARWMAADEVLALSFLLRSLPLPLAWLFFFFFLFRSGGARADMISGGAASSNGGAVSVVGLAVFNLGRVRQQVVDSVSPVFSDRNSSHSQWVVHRK